MTNSAAAGAFRSLALTGENDVRFSKVPEVALGFWIIKILATTLGETGGDAVTMSLGLGYVVGTLIFLATFFVAVTIQIRASRFNAYLYWLTIVATTTVGTTIADFVDRSLGVGYLGGSSILVFAVIASLAVWRLSEGTVSVNTVATPRVETFYWLTILFSQTLGTALGDWVADTNHLGYLGGALVFGVAIVLVAGLYLFTSVSRVTLFWLAFVLTRPLGATLGDLLDKPVNHGGFAINRFGASVILGLLIIVLIAALPQRSGVHPGAKSE